MIQEIKLKNYQKKALHEININYANGVKSQLLIMATGTGKTVVFCEFIKELISVNKKVLVLVHRDELINQAERRLRLHTNELFGIEKAERKANNEKIVLASVQTLKGKRLKKFAKDYFDAIIIDECHRSTANSYMAVRKHFNKAHVLGVTATPERQDDLKITKRHFQKIAFTYNILDAIKEGNLSNIKVWRVESEQDISGVKSNSDDLDQKELAKILDNKEYIEFIYKTIQEKASNKKIMVFMPSVKLSDKLCDFLNSKGIQSFSVSSNTPLEKRQEVLDDYRTGKIQVLSNYNIFTEGFDEPSIDCVIMARPTKSLIFYSQALGRMTRLFEGKEYGMFVDIGFINSRHKLAGVYNLIEETKEELAIEIQALKIMSEIEGVDIISFFTKYINSLKKVKKQNRENEKLNPVFKRDALYEMKLKEANIEDFLGASLYDKLGSHSYVTRNIKSITKRLIECERECPSIKWSRYYRLGAGSYYLYQESKDSFICDVKKVRKCIEALSKEDKYLYLNPKGGYRNDDMWDFRKNLQFKLDAHIITSIDEYTNQCIIFPRTRKGIKKYLEYEILRKNNHTIGKDEKQINDWKSNISTHDIDKKKLDEMIEELEKAKAWNKEYFKNFIEINSLKQMNELFVSIDKTYLDEKKHIELKKKSENNWNPIKGKFDEIFNEQFFGSKQYNYSDHFKHYDKKIS